MEHLQAYNKKLLSNILPVHVAEYFMSGDKNNDVRVHKSIKTIDNLLSSLKFRVRSPIPPYPKPK